MQDDKRIMVTLELPSDLKEILQEEAKENEMSLSGLIRSILKKHLVENNDKRRN